MNLKMFKQLETIFTIYILKFWPGVAEKITNSAAVPAYGASGCVSKPWQHMHHDSVYKGLQELKDINRPFGQNQVDQGSRKGMVLLGNSI